MCDMPREGAQLRLGAGGPMPPGAAEDLMGKINGAMPHRKPPKGAKTMDPKRITAPLVASAFADAEAELDDLEAQYARQGEQLQEARRLREAAAAFAATTTAPPAPAPPTPAAAPPQTLSADEAAQRITDAITSASRDGVQFFAKVPKAR